MGKQPGQMVVIMKVNISKTKKKVTGLIIGMMEKNLLEIGRQENNMDKEFIFPLMERKEKVFGKMGNVFRG